MIWFADAFAQEWHETPRHTGPLISAVLKTETDPDDLSARVDGKVVELSAEPTEHGVRLTIRHCGPQPASLEIVGPEALSITAPVSGRPEACTGASVPEPVEPSPETPQKGVAPVAKADRLTGFLCLLLMVGFLASFGFAIFAYVQRRQDSAPPVAPPAPPTPAAASPPSPPRASVSPVEKTPVSSGFEPRLPETHLEVVTGDMPAGCRWRFAGRMLRVGASPEDNDVVLDLPQVSGRHATFELSPDGSVTVRDEGSANGTWVDGERLTPHLPTAVRPGQQIALSSQLTVTLIGSHA